MKTLELMRALQGNKSLVLADAPLFTGRINNIRVVQDLCKVNLDRDWYIIAYNGIYTYRFRDTVVSNITNKDSPFHVLTTDNTTRQIREYVNTVTNTPCVQDASCLECLRQLVGRKITDSTLLLWMCTTDCDIDLSCLHDASVDQIQYWTKSVSRKYSGYTSVMQQYTDANGAQLKLVIDAVRSIVDSPVHSEERRIINANSLMQRRPQDPEKLLFWLLQAIKLLRIAEKET